VCTQSLRNIANRNFGVFIQLGPKTSGDAFSIPEITEARVGVHIRNLVKNLEDIMIRHRSE